MKLAPWELKAFQQQAKRQFVGKLAIYLTGLALPIAFALIFEYQWWVPVLMAVMLSHGTQLMHQLTHRVYKAKIDRVIGGLLGWMLMENFSEYQSSHLHHHCKIGTEKYHCHPSRQPKVSGLLKLVYVTAHLFKLVFYVKTLKRIGLALVGKSNIADNDKQRRLICTDYRVMLVGYFMVLASAVTFDLWQLLLMFWLIPVLIASVMHTLIEYTSHAGCKMDDPNPEFNARSIDTNFLMRWYSNNGCYHAEHHKYMAIPVDALMGLKDRIDMQLHYRCNGYFDLCVALVKGR